MIRFEFRLFMDKDGWQILPEIYYVHSAKSVQIGWLCFYMEINKL